MARHPQQFGAVFGLPTATWTTEAWATREGGHLVSGAIVGDAPDRTFTMTVDSSDFNSANNTAEAPAGFTPMGG